MSPAPFKHRAILVKKFLARRYDNSTLGNVRATQHLNKPGQRKHAPLLRVGGRELFGGNCLQFRNRQRGEEIKQARREQGHEETRDQGTKNKINQCLGQKENAPESKNVTRKYNALGAAFLKGPKQSAQSRNGNQS